MTITPPALAALDQAKVQANWDETIQALSEDQAMIDLRQGFFTDNVAYLHALLATRLSTQIDLYLQARSLLDIANNPELADDDNVDAVFSNFLVTRQPGANARGSIAIVVSDDVTVTIAAGSRWTAGTRVFVVDQVISAKADQGNVNSDSDRLFVRTSDGNYVFTVPATAEAEGADSAIRRGTILIPDVQPPNFVGSYAADDFSGGISAETNSDMLRRQAEGIPARTVSNRLTMRALLRATPPLDQVVRSTVIGMGDPEMSRDRHSIFGGSHGGRVDWYVRTAVRPTELALTKSAVFLGPDTDGIGVWQISVGRDEAPGFYEARGIRPTGLTEFGGGLEIVNDIRALDLTGFDPPPDIATIEEGTFTRFQTAIIRFRDLTTDVSLGLGTTADYDLGLVTIPLIGDLQDYMSTRDHRFAGADCVIRAPIPVFCQISFVIDRPGGSTAPDIGAIQVAVADTINAIGFTGKLFASQVYDAARSVLGASPGKIGPIDLFGRILRPDGETVRIRHPEVLTVPDDPAHGLTARVAQFFCDPEDVAVSDRPGLLPDES